MDWTAIFTAIKLLPRLFDLAEQLGKLIKEHNLEEWINDVDDSVKRLEDPNLGLHDRAGAARELLKLTRKL